MGRKRRGKTPTAASIRAAAATEKREAKARVATAALALRQQMSEVKIAPVDRRALTKDVTIVVAGNGIFEVRLAPFGVVTARVGEGIKGYPDQPVAWLPSIDRLPWEMFRSIVAFFREVKARHNTEALVRGYYHVNNGWALDVPPQRVSTGGVDVSDDAEDPGLGLWVLDVHSHPGTSSSFSGIDDEDETCQRIYGCVANLAADEFPNWHWRLGTGIQRWQSVGLAEVVDVPTKDYEVAVPFHRVLRGCRIDPFYGAEFPPEWMTNVTVWRPPEKHHTTTRSVPDWWWSAKRHGDPDTQPDLYEERYGTHQLGRRRF